MTYNIVNIVTGLALFFIIACTGRKNGEYFYPPVAKALTINGKLPIVLVRLLIAVIASLMLIIGIYFGK